LPAAWPSRNFTTPSRPLLACWLDGRSHINSRLKQVQSRVFAEGGLWVTILAG
jgi:hypothetical protein